MNAIEQSKKKTAECFADRSRTAVIILLVAAALMAFTACGKRGAPIPPSERVRQRVELQAFQRGNEIILSWKMPNRNAGKGSLQNISRIDVYRLAQPLSAPVTITEEAFSRQSTLISAVEVADSDFFGRTISHRDSLQFSAQPVRLRYAVRLVNASGQKTAFSNVVSIEPFAALASSPQDISYEVSQEAIVVKWSRPAANIDGSTPASIIGYNIYRSESDKLAGKLLNRSPITTEEYRDEFFDFGTTYYYFVRAVSVGIDAAPLESVESEIAKVVPKDTFPPSPPSSITVAAVPGTISLFFAFNPEKDIAGYTIYRTEDLRLPRSEWTRLTPELITANTFQDRTVQSGRSYSYYITATDTFQNISEPSEIVTEIAP
jgi:predicted small lipoprotein YifL